MAEPPDRGQRYPYPQTDKKRSKKDNSSRTYSKEETLAWLQFLAKRLNRESNSIFLIEQLNPNWLPPNVSPWLYRLGVGLTAGLIMEWFYGLPLGLMGGLLSFQMLSGLFAGLSLGILSSMNSDIKLFDLLGWSWSWSRAFKAIKPALWSIPVISIILLFLSAFSITSMHFSQAIILGLLTGLVAGIISGCVAGFVETRPKEKDLKVITTNQGIWRSAQKSIVASLATLILLILLILPNTFLSNQFFPFSIILGCIGLYVGGLSCLQHFTLRTVLWQTNNAPWNYAHFLNYGTERLLTKRSGGGYLFIHNLLRHNLAEPQNQVKPNRECYRQSIILGIIMVIIFLNSILLPATINSWKVSSEQAMLYGYHIKEGDRLITDLLFHRILKLKSGNIINFKPIAEMSYPSGQIINGEVLGCPGDTVSIKEGTVIINGKILPDQYLKMHLDISEYLPNSIPSSTYLIIAKKHEDNKNSLVMVPSSSIEEKVILRVWPTFNFI